MRTLVIIVSLAGLAAQADWPAVRQQALEHRLAGRGSEAVALLEAAVTRWPSNAETHFELGDTLLEAAWTAGGGATPEGTAALERAARHLTQASTLPGPHQPLALGKLVTIYDEGALDRPAEVERLAGQLAERDEASVVWPMKVAHSQVAQGRCVDGAGTLMRARPRVTADEHLLLGMAMIDLKVRCMDLPDASTRTLAQAALELGTEAVGARPADQDAQMLQSAAATMLAPLLPDGPERQRVDAIGTAAFDAFRALNPTRQRALAGEPPEISMSCLPTSRSSRSADRARRRSVSPRAPSRCTPSRPSSGAEPPPTISSRHAASTRRCAPWTVPWRSSRTRASTC